MSNKRPFMPFYGEDFFADTTHLTTGQAYAYLLLLWEYWRHGSLPNDDRQICRIARINSAHRQETLAALRPFFGPGWSSQKRADRELAKAVRISEARAENANRRWYTNGAGEDGPTGQSSPPKRKKTNEIKQAPMQLHESGPTKKAAVFDLQRYPLEVSSESEKSQQNQRPSDAIAYTLNTTHYTEESSPSDILKENISSGEGAREARYPSQKEIVQFKLEPETAKVKPMPKTKNQTRIPDDALPLPADRLAAAQRGMSEPTIEHEWLQFRNHHVARGSLFANWRAAWLHWVGKWASYGSRQIENAKKQQANYDVDRCRGDGMAELGRQLREQIDAERNRDNEMRDITPASPDAPTSNPSGKLH